MRLSIGNLWLLIWVFCHMLTIHFSDLHANRNQPAPRLHNLSNSNLELSRLRQEIAYNLRAVARDGRLKIPLRLRTYKVGQSENFYMIMARVSQDADTLSSLNNLSNPDALLPGQILLIPNARGIFKTVVQKKNARPKRGIHPVAFRYQKQAYAFYAGLKYQPEEMRLFRGDGFQLPLQKAVMRISSHFGKRRDPFHRKRTFHGGIDLAAPQGTPVFASRDGRVVRTAKNAKGYGQLVVIKHSFGYSTYYGHLSRIEVKRGQQVRAGQVIGKVGATGRATGPHLHFEVRKNGNRRNPALVHGLAVLR